MAADLLAPADKLQAMPGLSEVSTETATLLLEIATGVVQGYVGQDLVEVVDDTFDIIGTVEGWLELPQRPVSAVSAVEIDGVAVTDFVRHGHRLWRESGWAECSTKPSKVTGTYSHGRTLGHRKLSLARSATLMLAASQAAGDAGVKSEKIDDYEVVYERMVTVLEGAPHLRQSLKKRYGRKAGWTRLG